MDKASPSRVRAGGDLPLVTGLMPAVLEKGRPFRFEARGTSMEPFIVDGDILTVVPLAGSRPRPGDVAAFVHPASGGVRVHRVVKVEDGRYVLKGDNALDADGALSCDQILGVVVRLERGGRVRPVGRGLGAALRARLSRSALVVRLTRRARRLAGARKDRC
jgi:hypothetical protein